MGTDTMQVAGTVKGNAQRLVGKMVCWSNISGGYSAYAPSEGGCGIVKEISDTHITFESNEYFKTNIKPRNREMNIQMPIEAIIGLSEKSRMTL